MSSSRDSSGPVGAPNTTAQILIALGLLGGIGLALHAGADTRTRADARDYHATVASRIASSRLEGHRADLDHLSPGTHSFEISERLRECLPGGHAEESVRRVDGRVWEIEVSVGWQEPGTPRPSSVVLITRVLADER